MGYMFYIVLVIFNSLVLNIKKNQEYYCRFRYSWILFLLDRFLAKFGQPSSVTVHVHNIVYVKLDPYIIALKLK